MLFGAGGCGTSVSISTWQQKLEQYVRTDGRGDPNVLRNVMLDDSRPGFAVISAEDPKHSTDARGLLLAHKRIGDRPWFIYLVGLVKDEKVDDIRLAAVSPRSGQFRWATSPKNPKSLSSYRNFNVNLGKQRMPGQKEPPMGYFGFPREEDRFNLEVQGNRVEVVHEQSGAHWTTTVK